MGGYFANCDTAFSGLKPPKLDPLFIFVVVKYFTTWLKIIGVSCCVTKMGMNVSYMQCRAVNKALLFYKYERNIRPYVVHVIYIPYGSLADTAVNFPSLFLDIEKKSRFFCNSYRYYCTHSP